MSYCILQITFFLDLKKKIKRYFCIFFKSKIDIAEFKRGTKDTKGTVKLINLKQTDNAMAKNEKDKQKNNSTHDTT